MPLQKLQFRPGVNRESTTLANEGGWFESDKVRFRSGYPEKIGGWVKDNGTVDSAALAPATGSFWGICRSMWNWLNLSGYNLLALGTNLKYYIQNGPGGNYYDVTPIRDTNTAVANAFTTTYPTNTTRVQVNDPGHGAQTGDFVTISSVSGTVNGITAAQLDKEFQITYIDANSYYITLPVGAATSAGTPAVSATFTYQITTGNDIYTIGVGWGAGGWGGTSPGATSTGWGSAAPAGLGIGLQLRLWSQSNFGEDLVFNPRGGALYYWAVNANPNIYDRGVLLKTGDTVNGVVIGADCPTVANYVMVSDSSRFIITFGCNDYGSLIQNPMLVRWSDQESYATWSPLATNQAGSYQLSHGSQIVTALQTRQEILVITDSALYSMQYLGPPYVWGFQLMGDNISIMSPNAAITANNVTYWMGADKFYMYTGRVETLPCALRQYIYDDINLEQAYQIIAGTNEGYNEIWWYYCSANSTQIDKYVIYNHLERTWYYGTLSRSAWLDSPLRATPMGVTYVANGANTPNGTLVYHENGNDDGTTTPASPIEAYVQSSDFDIGDGHNFGMVWRIIPDVTFDGSTVNNPSLDFTVRPRQFPGTAYGNSNDPTVTSTQNYAGQRTYNVQQFTQQVYVRIRGRQMAFKVSSNDLGVAWQLGTPRIDVRPDGRR